MANVRLSGARRVEASARSAAPVARTVPKSTGRSYETLDRLLHATQGRLTHGISPVALWSARTDWLVHLLNAPGKQLSLLQQGWQDGTRLALWAQRRTLGLEAEPPAVPQPGDHRFDHDQWANLPFALHAQAFLLAEQWWRAATSGIRGVTAQHERQVAFMARQFLDVLSPSNFAWTNPEVVGRTLEENGINLLRGLGYWLEDAERSWLGGGRAPRATSWGRTSPQPPATSSAATSSWS